MCSALIDKDSGACDFVTAIGHCDERDIRKHLMNQLWRYVLVHRKMEEDCFKPDAVVYQELSKQSLAYSGLGVRLYMHQ